MTGMEILLSLSVMACSGAIIALLCVYQSLETSFKVHLRFIAEMRTDLMNIRFKLMEIEDGTGIPSMSEETKVEE